MKSCILLLALAGFVHSAHAGESPRRRIAGAVDRIEEKIDDFKAARRDGATLPVEELVAEMESLTGLQTRAALTRAAKYLDHRDPEVARCAVVGLVASEGDWRLLAGHLLAKRAAYRYHSPERHKLYLDVVRGIATTGYLGAFDVLAKALVRLRDADVVLTISRALVDLGDERAILSLFDFADWNRGKNETVSRAMIRKHMDPQGVRSKPEVRNSGQGTTRQTNRHSPAGTEPTAPAPKDVIGRVYRMLFELMGTEFETWESLVVYMQKHKKDVERRGLRSAALAKEQAKTIARLGR